MPLTYYRSSTHHPRKASKDFTRIMSARRIFLKRYVLNLVVTLYPRRRYIAKKKYIFFSLCFITLGWLHAHARSPPQMPRTTTISVCLVFRASWWRSGLCCCFPYMNKITRLSLSSFSPSLSTNAETSTKNMHVMKDGEQAHALFVFAVALCKKAAKT